MSSTAGNHLQGEGQRKDRKEGTPAGGGREAWGGRGTRDGPHRAGGGGVALLFEQLYDFLAVRVLHVFKPLHLKGGHWGHPGYVTQREILVEQPQVEHLQHTFVVD